MILLGTADVPSQVVLNCTLARLLRSDALFSEISMRMLVLTQSLPSGVTNLHVFLCEPRVLLIIFCLVGEAGS